jgi:hypothetical protein
MHCMQKKEKKGKRGRVACASCGSCLHGCWAARCTHALTLSLTSSTSRAREDWSASATVTADEQAADDAAGGPRVRAAAPRSPFFFCPERWKRQLWSGGSGCRPYVHCSFSSPRESCGALRPHLGISGAGHPVEHSIFLRPCSVPQFSPLIPLCKKKIPRHIKMSANAWNTKCW